MPLAPNDSPPDSPSRPDGRAVAVGTAAFLGIVALVLGVLHLGAPWMLQYRWREAPGSQAKTLSAFWSPTSTCHAFAAAPVARSVTCYAGFGVDGPTTVGWSVKSTDGTGYQKLPVFPGGAASYEVVLPAGRSERLTYQLHYVVEDQVQMACDLHGWFCLPGTRHARVTVFDAPGFGFDLGSAPAVAR